MAYFQEQGVDCSTYEIAQAGLERTALLAATVHLYLSSFTPTPQNVLADFVAAEATFAGYAASTIVWDAVGVDGEGNIVYQGSGPAFTCTGSTPANTIGGLWIELAMPGASPICFVQFGNPISINAALQFIGYVYTRNFNGVDTCIIQN
jgi:hypothetical protein